MRIETQRLILRPWCLQDIDEYAAICADPEVMRHLSGEPYTRMLAWRHVAFLVGHWQLRGFGHWALEEKASGRASIRVALKLGETYRGVEDVGGVKVLKYGLSREEWQSKPR